MQFQYFILAAKFSNETQFIPVTNMQEMHFGLDPKMLPVVHKKVSSQLRNGRACGNKYFFSLFV